LAQPFDFGSVLGLALPTVLVVHVKDQVDRLARLDQPRQQQPCQKGLAGAAFAKDPAGALGKTGQVEGDGDALHLQRLADVEIPLLSHVAKDQLHVLGAGLKDRRKVGRHRLDRPGLLFTGINDEHRGHVQPAKGGGAGVDLPHKVGGGGGGVLFDERVGAVQRHVGDDAEKASPRLAVHDHVAPHRQSLDDGAPVELDVQAFTQAAADDHAHLLGRLRFRLARKPGVQVFAFVGH
jgi:hypothetical protein